MTERRFERRMLCADLVEVCWLGQGGAEHAAIANLEDISPQGASVLLDVAPAVGTAVRVRCLRGDFIGHVTYCRPEPDYGHSVGIQFAGGSRWSPRKYRPRHLLDPRSLAPAPPPRAELR